MEVSQKTLPPPSIYIDLALNIDFQVSFVCYPPMNAEGLKIALERIAQEAEAKTGRLDIANLGLTGLPDELFELVHLEELVLGKSSVPSELYFDANETISNNAEIYFLKNKIEHMSQPDYKRKLKRACNTYTEHAAWQMNKTCK